MERRLVIGVSWPKGSDWEHCVRDALVEEGVIAASLPPAWATFRLKADTSMGEAQRIADCIRDRLDTGSGAVTVTEVDWPPSE